jgi:tetratricopeptide (TPR) repeat protein
VDQANTPNTQGNSNPLRSSVDWIVIGALVCALGALGVISLQLRQKHSPPEELNSVAAYENMARTQLQGGQLDAAQKTCELAIKKNFDGVSIRHLLVQAMYARGDQAGVKVQLAWGRSHADALPLHLDEISIAISRGELHRESELLAGLRTRAYPPELTAQYQSALAAIARALAEVGMVTESQDLLKSLPPATRDSNVAVALAEDGEVARAEELLHGLEQDHGQEPLWKSERLPEIRAALALAKHQPDQALQALEPNLQFAGLTFGPAYLRGEAYTVLGNPPAAQTEYLKITDHRYVDPLSNEYPLALLASARAYVLQSQPDQAHAQFERLLDLWRDADEDWPLLQAAKKESDSDAALDVSLKP